MIDVQNFSIQNFHGQRILHQLLNGALQRTRSKVWIVAFGEEQFFRGVGKFERNFAVRKQTPQIFEPQVDDLNQLLFAERMEDDDVVHAIEELGFEMAVQRVQHLL